MFMKICCIPTHVAWNASNGMNCAKLLVMFTVVLLKKKVMFSPLIPSAQEAGYCFHSFICLSIKFPLLCTALENHSPLPLNLDINVGLCMSF